MTVFASALLHECAHLCFLLSYGKTGIGLELRPGGAKITGGGYETLPYSQGLACAIAGPAVNALIAAGMFAASRIFCSERLFYAAAVNAALAGANLIPLSFLDGGRALMCVLAIKKKPLCFFPEHKADRQSDNRRYVRRGGCADGSGPRRGFSFGFRALLRRSVLLSLYEPEPGGIGDGQRENYSLRP